MTTPFLSRRDFIKRGTLTMLALGFPDLGGTFYTLPKTVGRVTTALIYVYQQPSLLSERVGKHFRDDLLTLLEELQSPKGPSYNPRWYRIDGGYVHSAYIQRVPVHQPNTPLKTIPEKGMLGEVTAPLTQTFYHERGKDAAWQPLYRLYYESVHWIKGIDQGPDGKAWYRLFDPKNDSVYFVPAADVRPIAPAEFGPIHQDVPAEDKHIIVNIQEQTLTAYEKDKVVLQVKISSGLPSKDVQEGDIPTDTPVGYWRITQKMPSRHMGNGRLTSQVDAYELPGVPWTMGFHKTGAALHGSFWHDNFGRRMSHGCVNMRNAEALWLFRWTNPVYEPDNWYKNGLGTLVEIR